MLQLLIAVRENYYEVSVLVSFSHLGRGTLN